MIKLIALDLDGTLTDDNKEISDFSKKTLHEAAAAGVKISLVSGRPTIGVLPIAEKLELKKIGGYVLAYNGGHILDCRTGKDIFKAEFPKEYIAEAAALAAEYQAAIIGYDEHGIVTEGPVNEYVEHESFSNSIPIKIVERLPEYLSFPFVKMLICADPKIIGKLEPVMAERFKGKLDIYKAENFFLEVMPPGIKKSAGLQMLSERLNINSAEIMACGDANNDLPMMKYAGLSVAVANAYDNVKAEADYITRSNNEDGVAYAIRKFVLNKE